MKPASWGVLLGDRCAGCRRSGAPLCRRCAARIPRPLDAPSPPGVAAVHAGWAYGGAGRTLVIAVKERGRRACAAPLADAAAAGAWRAGLAAEVLTWVPGQAADIKARGFDHAEALAQALAARLGLPLRPLLARSRAVPHQVGLSATARRANLRGAFIALPPVPRRVAIVDDVLTTGATAGACAAVLRGAGCHRVEVVVACRTS